MEEVVRNIKQVARNMPPADVVWSMIIDCAIQLPAKVPLYSLMLGIINVDDPAFVVGIIQEASAQLKDALLRAEDYCKGRLLLRFFASLVVTKVLSSASLISLLRSFVDKAFEIASKAETDDDGRSWQPYTDYVVYMALVALPFGSSELVAQAKEEIFELVRVSDEYLTKRRRSFQPALRPYAAPIEENDCLASYDSGSASFLPKVVDAVKEMMDADAWVLQCIPRVHSKFEGLWSSAEAHTIFLPPIPDEAPVSLREGCTPEQKAAFVLRAFPPRGVLLLPSKQEDMGYNVMIERIIAEDYVLDTIKWFEGDHRHCAEQLSALPLPYTYDSLVAEVLFGQILRLPTPEFKTILYSVLIVNLSKIRQSTFTRAIGSCVRESFSRMNVMDPVLRERLAEWLAYHLSNFDYSWPWMKWAHVLDAPTYDGQRRFCISVLNRLIRLSYWEKIESAVPQEFAPILPPKPEVAPLPTSDEGDLEGAWAVKALEKVRSKASIADMEAWIAENNLEEILGGKVNVLKMLARCLLVAGAKSYSHMIIALERYHNILSNLISETKYEGEEALLKVVVTVWNKNPQRCIMAVDRLTTLRLLSVETIAMWVFGEDGMRLISNKLRSEMALELLHRAVEKSLARFQDAVEDLEAIKATLHELPDAVSSGRVSEEDASGLQSQALEKESYLQETEKKSQDLIMQIIGSYVKALSPGGFAFWNEGGEQGFDESAMDFESSDLKVLHQFVLQSLRSFLCEYHLQIAGIHDRIRRDILEDAPQYIKEDVEIYLRP